MIKKIFAFLVILICVIFFLGAAAGLALTWIGRAQSFQIVDDTVVQANNALSNTQSAGSTLKTELDKILTSLDNINSMITKTSDKPQEVQQVELEIGQLLDTDLLPAAQHLLATTDDFYGKASALNQVVSLLNEIPTFNREGNSLDQANYMVDNILLAFQSAQDFRLALQIKQGDLSQKTMFVLTTPLNQTISKLTDAKNNLNQTLTSLSDLQTQLPDFQTRVKNALNITSIVLTVILAWLAISQIILFVICLRVLTARKQPQVAEIPSTAPAMPVVETPAVPKEPAPLPAPPTVPTPASTPEAPSQPESPSEDNPLL